MNTTNRSCEQFPHAMRLCNFLHYRYDNQCVFFTQHGQYFAPKFVYKTSSIEMSLMVKEETGRGYKAPLPFFF